MVIALHETSDVPAHRHPTGKAESYLVLEGILSVNYFDESGSITETLDFRPYEIRRGPFLGRHEGATWHQPFVRTGWAVYLETYEGPFNKAHDVEMMDLG